MKIILILSKPSIHPFFVALPWNPSLQSHFNGPPCRAMHSEFVKWAQSLLEWQGSETRTEVGEVVGVVNICYIINLITR